MASRGSRSNLCAVLAAGAVCAGAAMAQDSGFSPVDQTVEDVSPLASSLQVLQPDAGPPQGFGRVYTHPDYPNQYLRIEGAIIMAFPQSEYVLTEDGIAAVFPESTTFYIGGKPDYFPFNEPAPEEPTLKPSPYFLNYRLNAQTETLLATAADERRKAREQLALLQQSETAPATLTVWSSENYRQSRVGQLMRAAASSSR